LLVVTAGADSVSDNEGIKKVVDEVASEVVEVLEIPD